MTEAWHLYHAGQLDQAFKHFETAYVLGQRHAVPHVRSQRAKSGRVDTFLLNIGLPGMDVTQLSRRLRPMPAGRNALMVEITGYGQHFHRKNAFKAGFDHYFVKPIEPPKLLAVLGSFEQHNH